VVCKKVPQNGMFGETYHRIYREKGVSSGSVEGRVGCKTWGTGESVLPGGRPNPTANGDHETARGCHFVGGSYFGLGGGREKGTKMQKEQEG